MGRRRRGGGGGMLGTLWRAVKAIYKGTRNFFILGKVRGKTLILTDHARERMEQRHITLDEIKDAFKRGTVNDRKSEPRLKPYPKYVIDGVVTNRDPVTKKRIKRKEVEIVVSSKENEVIIVTVIDKDTDWPVPDPSSHH